jgi:DNA polymerase-4
MEKSERYRKIIHMDLDAFFCAVEELKNPALENKPFAVGGSPTGRGVIASCSYAARRFGVHSAMPTAQALRLCPQLILVSSAHREYSQKSKSVMKILADLTPLMEQISVDEAFLDVSDLPQEIAEIAANLQKRIALETGLPASFGLASNKLVAKIANDFGKKQKGGNSYPRAIQFVKPGHEAEFLAPLAVDMLWGVGPKTALRLKVNGVNTVGDLARASDELLKKHFGNMGQFLKRNALGIDNRPVEGYGDMKSISQEMTFDQDVSDPEVLLHEIKRISEKLGFRLRRNQRMAYVVRIKLRYGNFKTITRQATSLQAMDQDRIIFEQARQLLLSHWDQRTPIRLIGVGVSQFLEGERQLSLWGTNEDKESKLLKVVDSLKDKYGMDVIKKGSSLSKERNKP